MSGSSTCKLCGRPIVWGKTEKGKNLAVDPDPISGRRPFSRGLQYILEATGTEAGRVVFAVRRAREGDPVEQRRSCHFDTCPKQARGRPP